jgi:Beta/Gamma crystallin
MVISPCVCPADVDVNLQVGGTMNHIILFEHTGMRGQHTHLFLSEHDLSIDSTMGDRVSSAVVLGGSWRFYRNRGFQNPYSGNPILGPGIYPNLELVGIDHDTVSSVKSTSKAPTLSGAAVNAHCVLFEHINMLGGHRHVFNSEKDLTKDGSFNDRVSSAVILSGNWRLYRDSDWKSPYGAQILGPGMYASVEALAISQDSLSSLKSTETAPTRTGDPVGAEGLFFKHVDLRGPHGHVFETVAAVDPFREVSSFVLNGKSRWVFFSGIHSWSPLLKPIEDQPEIHPGARSPILASAGIYRRPTQSLGVDNDVLASTTCAPYLHVDTALYDVDDHPDGGYLPGLRIRFVASSNVQFDSPSVRVTHELLGVVTEVPFQAVDADPLPVIAFELEFPKLGANRVRFTADVEHPDTGEIVEVSWRNTYDIKKKPDPRPDPPDNVPEATARVTINYKFDWSDFPDGTANSSGEVRFTGTCTGSKGDDGDVAFDQTEDWEVGPLTDIFFVSRAMSKLRIGTWSISVSTPLHFAQATVELKAGLNSPVNFTDGVDGFSRGLDFP